MKILVIPDIHQSQHWQKLFKDPDIFTKYDHIVQLGDWFDTWEPDWTGNAPIKNFEYAIDIAKKHSNVHILLGNHDMSYVLYDGCSGHQSLHHDKIRETIVKNASCLSIAVAIDGWVFSHAGISRTWAMDNEVTGVDSINDMFYNLIELSQLNEESRSYGCEINLMAKVYQAANGYKGVVAPPKLAAFIKDKFGPKATLHKISKKFKHIWSFRFNRDGWDCYGNDKCQGPLWIRPEALIEDMYFQKQCVGHTETGPIYYTQSGQAENKLIVVDNRPHDKAIILDTDTDNFEIIGMGN